MKINLNQKLESINRIRGGYSLQNVGTLLCDRSKMLPRFGTTPKVQNLLFMNPSYLQSGKHMFRPTKTYLAPISSLLLSSPFTPHLKAKLHEHLLLATYPQDLPHWASGQGEFWNGQPLGEFV